MPTNDTGEGNPNLNYRPGIEASVRLEQEKLIGNLRAAAQGETWSASAAITVTKYLAAGAVGYGAAIAVSIFW